MIGKTTRYMKLYLISKSLPVRKHSHFEVPLSRHDTLTTWAKQKVNNLTSLIVSIMGRILIARCSNCGYQSETLHFGSGRCDNNLVCFYPALDSAENNVIRADLHNKETEQRINPDIIFYDDDSLHKQKSDSDEAFYRWGDYKLFLSGNYCPHCQEFDLRFVSIGLYD